MCDGVPLADLAALHGTPLYVYSASLIAARYRSIDEAFRPYPHTIHYALKANSTLAIARLLRGLGACADANSGGEIYVALRAGFIPPQIVFDGRRKTHSELAQAIDLGVKTINAESAGELERIDRLATARSTRAGASRCGSTLTSTRRAIRTSPRDSRPTSSASRSPTSGRCAGPSARAPVSRSSASTRIWARR